MRDQEQELYVAGPGKILMGVYSDELAIQA